MVSVTQPCNVTTDMPRPLLCKLMWHIQKNTTMPPFSNNWYPGTGTTHHAILDDVTLHGAKEYTFSSNVRADNGASLHIFGNGNTSISSSSKALHLQNILHFPNLTTSTAENNVFFEFHPLYLL